MAREFLRENVWTINFSLENFLPYTQITYTHMYLCFVMYTGKNGARNCVCKGKLFDSGNYFKTRMLDLVDTALILGKIQFPNQNEMIWEKQASTTDTFVTLLLSHLKNNLVNFEILNELLYVLSKKIVIDSQN